MNRARHPRRSARGGVPRRARRRRSTCCSPGTTSPAAASSAAWSPAPRSPCATSPAGSTRCAPARRFRPWTILGAGLLLAVGHRGACRCSSATRPRDRLSSTSTSPSLGTVTIDARRCSSTSACTSLVVGLVLMVFEAFGDDAAGDASRRDRDARGRPPRCAVRARHLPRAAAQAQPDHHRPRPAQPRRQRAADGRRGAAALPPLIGSRRPAGRSATRCRRRWRSPPSSSRSGHRLPARARLPQLAAHPRRRGRGRRRGPRASPAAAAPTRRSTTSRSPIDARSIVGGRAA